MRKQILIFSAFLPLSSNCLAQEEILIVRAEVLSVTNIRSGDGEGITELEDGTLQISNACGRYVANVRIKEVLVGSIQEPEIEIVGIIGEWCRPVLNIFPSDYVFELRKELEVFRNIDHIILYETSEGGLAANPMSRAFPAEDISDIEYMYYYSGDLTYRPEDLDRYRDDLDRSWFAEEDGFLDLIKGVKYESLREFLTSNKSLPE